MHTRAEIEEAFTAYQTEVDRIVKASDWAAFANMFTEDATYREHAYGDFSGRAEITTWITKTMGSYPGNLMNGFPIGWYVIDEPTSRVICDVRNLMPDPGDGSELEASNITILTYAGNGLWSCEEDIYNPAKFLELAKSWAHIAAEHGNLTPEGQSFLAAVSPGGQRPRSR
ncbi:MAG: hypothetical protein JWR35_696 [Marmoricola sp.]|nr:hypothetical protein [Marmoricola sp.]